MTTIKLTNEQIAQIAQCKDAVLNLKLTVNTLGLLNLVEQCYAHYTKQGEIFAKAFQAHKDELLKNHPEHKELLIGFFSVWHDPVKSNKYVDKHKELIAIVPKIEAINQAMNNTIVSEKDKQHEFVMRDDCYYGELLDDLAEQGIELKNPIAHVIQILNMILVRVYCIK